MDANKQFKGGDDCSYLDWLEMNWHLFAESDSPESAEADAPLAVPHPVMGVMPYYPIITTSEYIRRWFYGLKVTLYLACGVLALAGVWSFLSWFVNVGLNGGRT